MNRRQKRRARLLGGALGKVGPLAAATSDVDTPATASETGPPTLPPNVPRVVQCEACEGSRVVWTDAAGALPACASCHGPQHDVTPPEPGA